MSETESNSSVVESMEELRRAGGDAWDKVPDVATELGRDEPTVEDRLRTLEARLSDVEARRREIEASANRVDKLALVLGKKEAERKAAKTAWEEAVEAHMALSRHWSKSEEVASRPLIKACEAKADPVPADDSWRDEPIEVLQACGLSEGIVETLKNVNGFEDLGSLVDHDQGRYDRIAGIGKVKAKQIEDAFSAYWDARAADVQDADDAEDEAEDDEAPADGGYTNLPEAEAAYSEGLKEWVEQTDERSGLDLVTSHPDSTPDSNGVEATKAKPRRRRNKVKV